MLAQKCEPSEIKALPSLTPSSHYPEHCCRGHQRNPNRMRLLLAPWWDAFTRSKWNLWRRFEVSREMLILPGISTCCESLFIFALQYLESGKGLLSKLLSLPAGKKHTYSSAPSLLQGGHGRTCISTGMRVKHSSVPRAAAQSGTNLVDSLLISHIMEPPWYHESAPSPNPMATADGVCGNLGHGESTSENKLMASREGLSTGLAHLKDGISI